MEPIDEAWDKKKIIVFLLIAGVLLAVAHQVKVLVLDKNKTNISQKTVIDYSKNVAGAKTDDKDKTSKENQEQSSPFSFSRSFVEETAQEKLGSIKQQVASLKVEDVASSSPQIQKVINDLKALEQYPRDQAKLMCENICKSL